MLHSKNFLNFISDKAFEKAQVRYAELEALTCVDISAKELEDISKEGLGIDDILSGKKMLRL